MLTVFHRSHLWDSAFPGVALEAEFSSRTPAWWSQDPGHKHPSRQQHQRCGPTWRAVQISLAGLHPLCLPKSAVIVTKRTFLFQRFVHHWLPAPFHLEAILRVSKLFVLPPGYSATREIFSFLTVQDNKLDYIPGATACTLLDLLGRWSSKTFPPEKTAGSGPK